MNKTCSVIGCDNQYYAKALCRKHYQRTRTHGSPEDRKGHHVPLDNKFWSQVNMNGESVTPVGTPCWLWTGSVWPSGYGEIWWNGRSERTHRVAWTMEKGEIAEGLNVLHKCDTPLCVRVSHLFLGTHADNIADCIAKRRRVKGDHKGERSGRAKLTNADVLAIRADLRTNRAIAGDYAMDYSSISDIKRRKTWAHI